MPSQFEHASSMLKDTPSNELPQFLSTHCGKFMECKNPRYNNILIRLHKKSCDICKNKKITVITVNNDFSATTINN